MIHRCCLLLILLCALPAFSATVASRITALQADAVKELKPLFTRKNLRFPPKRFTLIALKQERELQLYAPDADGNPVYVLTWNITGVSGGAGPKLREGDMQVPEGKYNITLLNPNSICYLSLRIDYPNKFDRQMAASENRVRLGGDIMIHGGNGSVGCIAIGDDAIEKLFVLAYKTGISNIKLIISPHDPRTNVLTPTNPQWTKKLYAGITSEIKKYPLPAEKISTSKRERHQKKSVVIAISVILAIIAFTAISYIKYNPRILTVSAILTNLISIFLLQNLIKLIINGYSIRYEIFDIIGYKQLIDYLPAAIIFSAMSVFFTKFTGFKRNAAIISTGLLLILTQHLISPDTFNRVEIGITALAMLITSIVITIGSKQRTLQDMQN
jgi:hypothetical protein